MMEEILTQHRQDFHEIRRLCFVCHGLDLTTSSFSTSSSRLKATTPNQQVLQNLISSNILSLAIGIRINLYQGNIDQPNIELPESAWLYYDDVLIEKPATLKQVCDKIIHADSITKPILPRQIVREDSKIATQLKGAEYNKKAWTLNIVLERFAEDILNLLEDLESKNT